MNRFLVYKNSIANASSLAERLIERYQQFFFCNNTFVIPEWSETVLKTTQRNVGFQRLLETNIRVIYISWNHFMC